MIKSLDQKQTLGGLEDHPTIFKIVLGIKRKSFLNKQEKQISKENMRLLLKIKHDLLYKEINRNSKDVMFALTKIRGKIYK